VHILLIAADGPLGLALQTQLAELGRHRVTPLGVTASRWKSERQAKKAARRADVDLILDLRTSQNMAAGEGLQAADLERTTWLAKVARRGDIPYLYVSDPRVFSGLLSHPYREQETPDAVDPLGASLIEAEGHVQSGCDQAIILRLGPIFSSVEQNLLTDVLGALVAGSPLAVDDLDQWCPVATADAARVISGVLDQLDTGAETRGVFHYNSSDGSTAYGFAETVLAAASQFIDVGDTAIVRLEHDTERAARNWSLDCRDIRDTFAIKQVSWRSAVGPAVRDYLAARREAGKRGASA
jgi:dTDP-4-dehydrorhamnose reductase